MIINNIILDKLTEHAEASPLLRMNPDLLNSPEDQSRRIPKAIEPGSPMLIRWHRHSSETEDSIHGQLEGEFYDDRERMCADVIELRPTSHVVAPQYSGGSLTHGSCTGTGYCGFKYKDEPYEPLGKKCPSLSGDN